MKVYECRVRHLYYGKVWFRQNFPQSKKRWCIKIREGYRQYRCTCDIADFFVVSKCLHFRNRGHQNDRCRAGNGRRKKNAGKSHSGKNSIETQSFGWRETIHTETLGNQYNFDGGQYREKKPVQSQGKCHMPDLRYFLHRFFYMM